MHQTKKGNEWHFGMKAHIGADADSGLVHSLHTTAANESDVAHTHHVLHGQETTAFLDASYTGVVVFKIGDGHQDREQERRQC